MCTATCNGKRVYTYVCIFGVWVVCVSGRASDTSWKLLGFHLAARPDWTNRHCQREGHPSDISLHHRPDTSRTFARTYGHNSSVLFARGEKHRGVTWQACVLIQQLYELYYCTLCPCLLGFFYLFLLYSILGDPSRPNQTEEGGEGWKRGGGALDLNSVRVRLLRIFAKWLQFICNLTIEIIMLNIYIFDYIISFKHINREDYLYIVSIKMEQ